MGRSVRAGRRSPSCHLRSTPYPMPSSRYASERRDWEQATCSVCLEYPHNAVLLLCSSHDMGCRPYMCDTGCRHSNCLDLFKKAYAKLPNTTSPDPNEPLLSLSLSPCKKSESTELTCPLCRGQVKGWTVVDPARKYLNRKRRSCIHDGCSFVGTYKQLKKHAKVEHRRAKPRKVDPVLEEKWRALEMQSERQDVMSTIRSSMPRAVVLGDYVIDMASGSSDMDDFDDDDDDDEFSDDYGEGRNFGGNFRGRGASRRISRSLLYYIFREGARLSRHRRENTARAGGGVESGDAVIGYPSEEDEYNDGGGHRGRTVDLMRDARRHERRRRRRGRGRLMSGRG